MVGGFFGFTLPITAFTSLIVGLLGVPGVAIIAAWVFLL
ncbi:MAG: pro-sigmaK processing inhibitor BofA family protein [Clostridia bacterium]|nr:pro-sigmaK processing inhibitor BofA family protein [Clostridia bacterium]